MELLFLLIIIVIIVFLSFDRAAKLKLKQDLEQVRNHWAASKPKKEHYNFIKIARYVDTLDEKFHRLTEQTVEDIDFNKLFKFIDRTTCKVGQQFLYKKLIEPTNTINDPCEEYIELFTNNKELREQVQSSLLKLRDDDAYHITSLLFKSSLSKPKWIKWLKLDLILILVLIIISIKFPISLLFLIIPFTLNIYLHLWNKNNTFHFMRSVPQLILLIQVADRILKTNKLLDNASVVKSISHMSSIKKNARFITFNEGGIQNEVGQYVSNLFKSLFLIEVLTLFKIAEQLKDKRASIQVLFSYVGHIDTCLSIASLRASKLSTCKPNFVAAGKELKLKGVYHPLVKNCIPNDLTIDQKSVLITGSNMSGKSTFLRTIAINSILAQTIFTCFADEYHAPILKQFSSIRIDDNLFEGKSYFFEEVSVVGELIEKSDKEAQSLFLLDEVFKGTNTVERIASAKAILSYLNQRSNIVLVATHDIELANLLKDEYDLYHFTEIIENNQLEFDHCIKPGPLKTRNAIKLLELAQYPEQIITDAKNVVGKGNSVS